MVLLLNVLFSPMVKARFVTCRRLERICFYPRTPKMSAAPWRRDLQQPWCFRDHNAGQAVSNCVSPWTVMPYCLATKPKKCIKPRDLKHFPTARDNKRIHHCQTDLSKP